MINKLIDFLHQDEYFDFFLTGPAGSGKTTSLKEVVDYLKTTNLNFMIVSYTHKAKEVLQSKLPEDVKITTLHSFLKKRPGINKKAKHIKQLTISTKMGKPEQIDLLIVDEFSFIGEEDALDLQALQDPLELELYKCDKCGYEFNEVYADHKCENCGCTTYQDISLNPIKIIYVGDLNQLSPIKGPSAIEPYEPYWVKLTKVHRNDFPQLQQLVSFIEGTSKPTRLEESENFKRNVDIDKAYKESKAYSKIMLAYTNKAVQEHNANIKGYAFPKLNDLVYVSSLKKEALVLEIRDQYLGDVITPTGTINETTKYNPLKFLNKHKKVKFFITDIGVIAGIFGSYNNKLVREEVANKLIIANKKGKDSLKEFREYKNLNDYVCSLDFNYCMTVHKSQGSEFDEVYVDLKSFSACLDSVEKLKLLYVAMSRAKNKIYLNA